ncbi:MAG: RNA polymerase sigma factor [Bacteriovoracia bacterium]
MLLMSLQDINWDATVLELGPKLYRYFSGLFPPQTASDLVQETFMRLLKKIRSGEFQPEMGALPSYAFGIARWIRIERARGDRKNQTLQLTEEFDVVSSETPVDRSNPAIFLRWAIGQLKPVEQEVILRMIDGECGLEQIGGELGMPLGTVKSHAHRAKIRLKELMEVTV